MKVEDLLDLASVMQVSVPVTLVHVALVVDQPVHNTFSVRRRYVQYRTVQPVNSLTLQASSVKLVQLDFMLMLLKEDVSVIAVLPSTE